VSSDSKYIFRQIPSLLICFSLLIIAVLALNYCRALKTNTVTHRFSWEEPTKGYNKPNVDAAFSQSSFSGATVVIRDDRGLLRGFWLPSCRPSIEGDMEISLYVHGGANGEREVLT
jgi:hypothetical protein